MTKRIVARTVAIGFLLAIATGCAVRPVVDPRHPGPVRDSAVRLRVCSIQDDGAHLALGDRVELTTSKLGRLRIRHLPANGRPAWNGGDDTAVKDAVLVEAVTPVDEQKNTRRFVPVGRFSVQTPESSHSLKFDFLASKAVGQAVPACGAAGSDVVMIRGVEDQARHGGHAILLEE
jgi:hypothetical protein